MTTTTPIKPRSGYGCPEWCDRPDDDRHHVDFQDGRAVIDHDGPSWGPYIAAGGFTFAETGEVAELDITISNDIEHRPFTPAELRQLAADALAAAHWLEARS
jgi:hypothetical protein